MAKQIDAYITRLLAGVDVTSLESAARGVIKALKRNAADARLDTRDYEFAETRAEQQRRGAEARKRLEAVRADILTASQYNIISPVEVAELSANIDYLLERLD